MIAVNLRTEHMINPLGIDIRKPYLSWNCMGGLRQTAFALVASSKGQVIFDSGKVVSSRMSMVFEQPLQSRQHISWRVRLWDENDRAGEWSTPAAFEMGLLEQSQFWARWINPELTCDPQVHKPASHLRTTFTAHPSGGAARLYVTCHGLYEVYLNGQRAGDFVLAPGAGTYDKKLAYQTVDVTGLIKDGDNDVCVILGDGWYRSCSGVDGDRNLYGTDVALWFQLEVDGVPVCISDERWQATQAGPLRENDMQQGEIYDANREVLTDWHGVKVEDFGTQNLACANSVPVTEQERFVGTLMTTPDGGTVIDYGQNLAGYVEFSVEAHGGERIVMTHGEALDENGNFTVENFQDRKRHKEGGIRQQVVYICKPGHNHYKARFTIWGFRYAKIETDVDLTGATFTAIAVYSAMTAAGTFECSNALVNQLVHNSRWSLKSNFCDVPTDCPTRERAAWTGDMGVFAGTGLFLEDCYPVMRKWLGECRLNQYADGRLANIAPRNNVPSYFTELLSGSVGWGDACIIVPYVMYQRFGDPAILAENYEMMQKWYGFLESRAKKCGDGVVGKDNPYEDYTIDTGVDYGEWCEPDVSGMAAMAKPQYKVATAYFARSGRMLAQIAQILGKDGDAAHYQDIADHAARAFHHVATEDGRITSERQAEYVRAIAFGILEEKEAMAAAADLNALIVKNDYHLNTGFLSTPFLCGVLTEYGYVETAYRLLLQETMPGWLYAVKKGATTIWENWDGINGKGEVKASLNHYAYGAICGWLFSGVCGIIVASGKIRIAPHPFPALEHARASYGSPLGEIVSGWRYEADGTVTYEISVPANGQAEVELPDGRKVTLGAGKHRLASNRSEDNIG